MRFTDISRRTLAKEPSFVAAIVQKISSPWPSSGNTKKFTQTFGPSFAHNAQKPLNGKLLFNVVQIALFIFDLINVVFRIK